MSEEKNPIDKLILNHNSKIAGSFDAPVFFLVHGRAGNKEVMQTFARALPIDSNIIYPEALYSDPIGGYSWWDINNNEGKKNQRNLSALKLTNFISESINYYKLKPKRIVAIGFSQGAAILSQIMQGPENIFDGVAILSGFIITDIEYQGTKLASVFVCHGTKDQTVPIEKAREGRDYLYSLGLPIKYFEEDMGHKVGVGGMRELKAWIITNTS